MSSSSKVLLLLGAGANVGASVARSFAAKGYKVALTSRTARPQGQEGADLHVQADLADPESVASVFQKVERALGAPTVVVYNAAAFTKVPAENPVALSVKDLNRDFQVNTASVLQAAHEAVARFDTMSAAASRTFIYTGNILNSTTIAPLLSGGIGKAATAHLIESASKAYEKKGYRFFYADERKIDGSPAYGDINGQAHGDFYVELAEGKSQVPWLATFVGGKGYVNFKL